MAEFTSDLVIKLHDGLANEGRGEWEVVEPFGYRSDVASPHKVGDTLIVVPAGFRTDFASVPNWPIAAEVYKDCARKAAVIHAYLYRTGRFSREVCDAVFREAGVTEGYPVEIMDIMWLAVRQCGERYFDPFNLRGTLDAGIYDPATMGFPVFPVGAQ